MKKILSLYAILLVSLTTGIVYSNDINTNDIRNKFPLVQFFMRAVNNLNSVGALVPTSKYTGHEAIKHIKNHNGQKKILEIGAGIGNITEIIEKHLKDGDILDVVELDPAYYELLKIKFGNNNRINIYCADFTQFDKGYQYDFIISTLPHTSLPLEIVRSVLDKYKELIIDGGWLAYVEYIGFSKLTSAKMLAKDKNEQLSYREKIILMKLFQNNNNIDSVVVLRNIPPIFVHHVKIVK